MHCLDPNRNEHGTSKDVEQDLSQDCHWKFVVARGCIFDQLWHAELGRELELQWGRWILCSVPKY